ncbi:MAG: YeeE/YedE family protein [Actinomycetota bacterium]
MEEFTPVSGLIGGLLIGLAVVLLLLLNGRIGGISGIVGGLLAFEGRSGGWRAAFVAGLILGALVYLLAASPASPVEIRVPLPVVVAGGFLVGLGTRLGSGCTSGHGLCGLARLSRRSVVATSVFFGVAMLTVFVTRHAL